VLVEFFRSSCETICAWSTQHLVDIRLRTISQAAEGRMDEARFTPYGGSPAHYKEQRL